MSSPSRPPGIWAKTTMYFNSDQKEYSNDFWWSLSAATVITDMEADAAAIVASLVASYEPILSAEWTIRGGYTEFSDGATTIGVDTYRQDAGGVSSPPMPEDVAVIVQKFSSIPGRQGRGRLFIAGIPQTFCDGSYLNAAPGQSLTTAFITAIGANVMGSSNTYTPAHFSRNAAVMQPVVFWDFAVLLGTRRRRRGPF